MKDLILQRAILLGSISLLVLISCGRSEKSDRKTVERTSLINTAHLEHLSQTMEVEGEQCRVIRIYSEAPDYQVIPAEGEGIACVDDVARAARFYAGKYRESHLPEDLETLKGLMNFVLVMQNVNGEFYNFIFADGRINREHKNSRKSPGWWTARGFRSLAEAMTVFKGLDESYYIRLSQAALRSVEKLHERLTHSKTAWSPAPDVAAVYLLGLVTWRDCTELTLADPLIESLASTISQSEHDGNKRFPYKVHRSWQNVWHAWGALQVEALARAGKALSRNDWIESAREEAEGFHRQMVANGWISSIEYLDSDSFLIKEYPQIAYGISSIVSSNTALYEVTRDTSFAVTAGLSASWFQGNNSVGVRMYDPETGRCYDGINNPREINKNSGAESTIEALLTLQQVEGLPFSESTMFVKTGLLSQDSTVLFESDDYLFKYKQANQKWNVTIQQKDKNDQIPDDN